MSKIKLTLPEGETLCEGKLISFKAPCECSAVEEVEINETTFQLVDAAGNPASLNPGGFVAGSMISIILDVTNSKAFLQYESGVKVRVIRDETAEPILMCNESYANGWYEVNQVRTSQVVNHAWILPETLVGRRLRFYISNSADQTVGINPETRAIEVDVSAGRLTYPARFGTLDPWSPIRVEENVIKAPWLARQGCTLLYIHIGGNQYLDTAAMHFTEDGTQLIGARYYIHRIEEIIY